MQTTTRRFAAITLLLVAGILAGTQLGKIAPLVGWYRDSGGMSLVEIGWLTALLGLFVALAALPASFAIVRAGLYRSFAVSALLLFIGGVGIAVFESPALVLISRLVEGLGYLPLVIATPALVSALSPASLKAPALAIWGGFVPIGFAIADFLSAATVPAYGPRVFLAIAVLAFGLFALLATLLAKNLPVVDEPPAPSGRAPISSSVSAPVLMVAAAFGVYVVLSIGFFAFLPAFVASAGSDLLIPAGVIALIVPVGNVLTGILMAGRGARFAAILGVIGFLLAAARAVPLFTQSGPAVSTFAAVMFAIAGGVIASALFASVPFITPPAGSISVAIGFIAQAGGISTVAAPPLAGFVIETYGFAGLGWFLTGVALIGPLLIAPMLKKPLPTRAI